MHSCKGNTCDTVDRCQAAFQSRNDDRFLKSVSYLCSSMQATGNSSPSEKRRFYSGS